MRYSTPTRYLHNKTWNFQIYTSMHGVSDISSLLERMSTFTTTLTTNWVDRAAQWTNMDKVTFNPNLYSHNSIITKSRWYSNARDNRVHTVTYVHPAKFCMWVLVSNVKGSAGEHHRCLNWPSINRHIKTKYRHIVRSRSTWCIGLLIVPIWVISSPI